MPPSLLLHGSRGRMGHAVATAAAELGVPIAAAVDAGDDPAAVIASCDVIVDFSSPAATGALLELAVAHRKPVVIGTTGQPAAERERLRTLAARIPCVWSANYSVGVNLLFHLTGEAARLLGEGYDAEIVEMHHRHKKDAPSGTAARLLEIVLAARRTGAARYGRHGLAGPRPTGEVGVHALRGGDVVGDHTVIFAGPGERIELTHKAADRSNFARGALCAAQWVVTQPAGLYDMQDVLGLRA